MFYSLVIAVVTALPAWASPASPTQAETIAPAHQASSTPVRRVATPAPRRIAQTTGTMPADRAALRVRRSLSQLSQLAREMRQLKPSYESQLKEVDRLKRRRPSWRRDNQIRSQLKKAQAIAKRLGQLSRSARTIRGRVRGERLSLRAAIRTELSSRPTAARRARLLRMQTSNQRALHRASRKIVLPDSRIDPLADPEDLDDQAARIVQAEKRLAQEIAALDTRAKRYQRMVKLRRTRQRAADLSGLDDNRPRRTTGRLTAGGRNDESGGFGATSDDGAGGSPAPPEQVPGDPSVFDSDPIVVLADVVDAQTLDALRRAESSTDPAIKAKAAARARGQVRARLKRLQKRRQLIQRRAKQLRRR